ncbi:unnamed protein product [Aphanomyces euteiches]
MLRRACFLASFVTLHVTAGTFSGDGTTYGDGDPGNGNCALMKYLPSATAYHVALNNDQYDSGANCGRCVKLSCTDSRCKNTAPVVAQIVDRCPECKQGDLDMSLQLWNAVTGYPSDRVKITWDYVDCDVQGGIQVCAKEGSSIYWLYVQPGNTRTGVQSMKINGADAPIFSSAYYFMSTVLNTIPLSQTTVEMTAYTGETIKATVSLTANQCTQIPQQFKGGPSTPTVAPTVAPTQRPTSAPTQAPTQTPTQRPTQAPTQRPTQAPTEYPTLAPTQRPTKAPTQAPTQRPTQAPTQRPTSAPTHAPTQRLTTQAPTKAPTQAPPPTQRPTSASPTLAPTQRPTTAPTKTPTSKPPSTGGTVGAWQQCGGNGYTGATGCVSGYTCKLYSEWYSQCIPA